MSESKMFKEKREFPRMAIALPLKYRLIEDLRSPDSIAELRKKEVATHTADVGLGGMFISMERPVNVGSILSIQFSIPGKANNLSAFVEVVWANDNGGGVHFLALKEEDKDSLGFLLAKAS